MAITAGIRHNAYLAAELDLSFVWAARTGDYTKLDGIDDAETDSSKNLKSFEITFNLKGYPLGYFEVPQIPDWVQPFARIGFGFGETEVGSLDEARFLIRFGGGVDFLIFDQLGVYLDGGYTVVTNTTINSKGTILDGQGQIRAGVLVRF